MILIWCGVVGDHVSEETICKMQAQERVWKGSITRQCSCHQSKVASIDTRPYPPKSLRRSCWASNDERGVQHSQRFQRNKVLHGWLLFNTERAFKKIILQEVLPQVFIINGIVYIRHSRHSSRFVDWTIDYNLKIDWLIMNEQIQLWSVNYCMLVHNLPLLMIRLDVKSV